MAYSDSKSRKVRSRSWTKADEQRWQSQERRQRKADEQARLEKEKQIADMKAAGTYEQFLAQKRADEEKAEAERQEQIKKQQERAELIKIERSSDARLMAGGLQSEFASAIGWREKFGQPEGDWLDDPVEALTTGYGFGEEVRTSRGIKMQVHLCLDCSNSMKWNGCADVAQETVQSMYWALRMAAEQLPPGSLVAHVWSWAHYDKGKGVQIHTGEQQMNRIDNDPLKALDRYWASFDGEDTWISPLLERLETWETKYGDPGAYRLDIIITDGVLEHATDSRKGDEIQERRDGSLQTIVLNFLPVEEWVDSRVPKRCVQYAATPDNLIGLVRNVLGGWLVNM